MTEIDPDVPAMWDAHERGDLETVRRLIDARPNLKPVERTWLDRAAETGQIAIVDFWLARGCKLKDDLLLIAKDAAMTRHLLGLGANPNIWDRYAGTPLHRAVARAMDPSHRGRQATTTADIEQLRVLLEAGADPAIANFEGQTPLAFAMALRRKGAAEFLKISGAPEKGKRPSGKVSKPPSVDLRKDATKIATALTKAITRFERKQREPLTGVYLAVSGIEGFVSIAFDVSGSDGPWNASHEEYAVVQFAHWRDSYAFPTGPRSVISIDGVVTRWPGHAADEEFEKPFFEACMAVLQETEKTGALAKLPHVEAFTLGVEDSSGLHGTRWKWSGT